VVYGAGSLREAIGQIPTEFGHSHGLTTQFGPSGRMRERIQKGERVDLFASANVGHARACPCGGMLVARPKSKTC
jgi:ABC-type molybdate transport system substrate-binding protein